MAFEKTGDISSETPNPGQDEKQAGDKANPSNEEQADLMEDSPMTRTSNAAARRETQLRKGI